ncbi:MAG: class I SAM-dependent methyltransferase [Ktedonobacteraceae bacterium]|nr:class I SAM-dependent methyltransferase [Ktedonobacteraceae bacterium]MBA3825191.1 class I SAM-dependent methyltransferase [Ktedonobacterales bacterium]
MPDSPSSNPAFLKTLATMPINGRDVTSPAESPYFLPNILMECKRLDLEHFIYHRFFQQHFFAPIGQSHHIAGATTGSWTDRVIERALQREIAPDPSAPKRILDIGCGTGQWAMAMAKQFPNAWVVGLDSVAPARPFPVPLPANFTFLEANILHGLPAFGDASFDFVHMRCLGWGIPAQQWQHVIDELARVTVPGGWIETVEADLPHDTGPAFATVRTMLETILAARGVDLACSRRIDSYLRHATPSVHAISSYTRDIPLGAAGGGHGARMAWNVLLQLDVLAPFFLQTHCWDAPTWQALRAQIEAEFNLEDAQPSVTMSIAMGQKK